MPRLAVENRTGQLEYDRDPDECPLCHRHVHPTFKTAWLKGEIQSANGRADIEAVFLCPNDSCRSLFIAYLKETRGDHFYGSGKFELCGTAPRRPAKPVIFAGIEKLSHDFVEIYCQACAAEAANLVQVAGVGYRKALEFLVKDFCCSLFPNDVDKIKGLMLGPCIDSFVKDENIRDCAKLAAWLGNDETHYVRKWADKDISDLKALLGLTMSWIETSLKTAAYRESMLNKVKPD